MVISDGASVLRRRVRLRGGGLFVLLAVSSAMGCSAGRMVSGVEPRGDLVASDPRVSRALVAACYECHSNRSEAPWTAKLAPSYWFAGSAREALNFSDWSTYAPDRVSSELAAITRSVSDGDMPPWDYTLLRGSAELSSGNKAAIVDWASKGAVVAAH